MCSFKLHIHCIILYTPFPQLHFSIQWYVLEIWTHRHIVVIHFNCCMAVQSGMWKYCNLSIHLLNIRTFLVFCCYEQRCNECLCTCLVQLCGIVSGIDIQKRSCWVMEQMVSSLLDTTVIDQVVVPIGISISSIWKFLVFYVLASTLLKQHCQNVGFLLIWWLWNCILLIFIFLKLYFILFCLCLITSAA